MDIFISVFTFVLMIAVGYSFKHFGLMTTEHGRGMSTLVLNFTLPCAILTGFAGIEFSPSFMVLFLFGFLGNLVHVGVGYLIGGRRSMDQRRFWMLCMAGYNIGCFSLPFASAFLGSYGVVASSLFDSGNAMMCLGLNLTIMQFMTHEATNFSPKRIGLDLLKRPAFVTYMAATLLLLLGISLPEPVYRIASCVGKANGPMSMFMLGLLAEVSFRKDYLKDTLVVLAVRFMTALLVSFAIFSLSFLPYEMRKAGIMIAFSPISSATTAYLARYNCRTEQAAFINTVTILFSMVAITLISVIL